LNVFAAQAGAAKVNAKAHPRLARQKQRRKPVSGNADSARFLCIWAVISLPVQSYDAKLASKSRT